jgi:hypothetical protein
MILWGNFKGPHLVDRIGHVFSPLEAGAASIALIAAMLIVAAAWNRITKLNRWISRSIIIAGSLITLYIFFYGI